MDSKRVRFSPDLPKFEGPRNLTCLSSNGVSNKRRRPARSAPISLPKTHIHRTPSEIQLADEILYAECKDVAMYSRLMLGMLHQIQERGNVENFHPLSKKSMLHIARTKEANDWELEHHQENGSREERGWDVSFIPSYHVIEGHDDHCDDENNWDVSYCPIDEDSEHSSLDSLEHSSLDSSEHSFLGSSVASSSVSRQPSKNSMWTLPRDDKKVSLEDDCIFRLEM